jgi:DeoR family fructose operon transcriptional repressor
VYAAERQEAIAAHVARRGRAAVAELAERFDVTAETVRRDLDTLEERGIVRRVHGGAVPGGALGFLEHDLTEREVTNVRAKERIARAALDLVPPSGSSILLDAGTTTQQLAGMLPLDVDLAVFTNSVPVASRVAGWPGYSLHLLGGRVRGTTRAAVGPRTEEALGLVHVDVAFLGTNGLTVEGCTTPDELEAATKRAMVAAATTVVVLADGSKLGVRTLHRTASLDQVDVVVTDADAPADQVAALRAAGGEVIVA